MRPSIERVLRRDYLKKPSRPYLLYAIGLLAGIVLGEALTDALKARAQSIEAVDEARLAQVVKACEAKVRELAADGV